jgi:uncharacterized protein YaaR (DUF327 family)
VLAKEREGEAAAELGPLADLPVSDEAVNTLMDEVRSAGDELKGRPFPDEIVRYKQAVRNFMHYVVENGYTVNASEGIPKYLKPGFRGRHGTPESQEHTRYISVQVIDKKLEDMAAMLIAGQMKQIELVSRLEEITGLLIDLMQ